MDIHTKYLHLPESGTSCERVSLDFPVLIPAEENINLISSFMKIHFPVNWEYILMFR